MLKKFTNKKGFTLMEMLIVVAIIAILIAIAIPTFNNALNKAKVGTDTANIRSGYAAAKVELLTGNLTAETTYTLCDDGSVKATGGAGTDYVTKGNNEDGKANVTIGENANITWKVGAKITYKVNPNGTITITPAT